MRIFLYQLFDLCLSIIVSLSFLTLIQHKVLDGFLMFSSQPKNHGKLKHGSYEV
ncbi:hypothetical protein N665_0213s0007 [Sinapis alba]|nr:hypothetical protein N665_0213s0007 [Sinapis alba]